MTEIVFFRSIEKEAGYIRVIKDRLNWGSSLNPDVEFEFIGGDAK